MPWNYDGRRFRVAANSAAGETSHETTFLYHQQGDTLWGSYEGGEIVKGVLVGLADTATGKLNFHYSHVNRAGNICSGKCQSSPQVLADGRIRLAEKWCWTTGDGAEGESTLEELVPATGTQA